jgi:aspartate-semialdehyde dehydrogenase
MSPDQHFAAAADLAVRRRLPAQPAVAVVGATGAVGVELIACLEDRGFPLSRLRLLASSRSAGRCVMFRDQTLAVETLGEDSFAGIDLALFSAGSGIRSATPIAAVAGAAVVDNLPA